MSSTPTSPSGSVCLVADDYVRDLQYDHRTAIWVAELSDGRSAWMDDHRPGEATHSAWLRLREFIASEGVAITGMHLRFRSNAYRPPATQSPAAWFFSKSAVRTDGLGETLSFYLLGWLQDGGLRVQRVKVPELTLTDETERDPAKAGACLIWNPGSGRD